MISNAPAPGSHATTSTDPVPEPPVAIDASTSSGPLPLDETTDVASSIDASPRDKGTAYVAATTKLLPWYAGAMIPLALANVLVNDLMARAKFKAVLPMVLVAVAYGFTLPFMLRTFPGHMEVALKTLGVFNLLLLGVCALFTWGIKSETRMEN